MPSCATAPASPLQAGECEYLRAGFRHLLANGCVDIAQPDICAAGGLTETRRIAALAETFGTNVTPHCWGTGIAFATALHFTSTLDMLPGRLYAAEPLLEMDRSENPLRDRLTLPRFEVENGAVAVPNTPGLGSQCRSRPAGRLQPLGQPTRPIEIKQDGRVVTQLTKSLSLPPHIVKRLYTVDQHNIDKRLIQPKAVPAVGRVPGISGSRPVQHPERIAPSGSLHALHEPRFLLGKRGRFLVNLRQTGIGVADQQAGATRPPIHK